MLLGLGENSVIFSLDAPLTAMLADDVKVANRNARGHSSIILQHVYGHHQLLRHSLLTEILVVYRARTKKVPGDWGPLLL